MGNVAFELIGVNPVCKVFDSEGTREVKECVESERDVNVVFVDCAIRVEEQVENRVGSD